jgi:hypothetical protein
VTVIAEAYELERSLGTLMKTEKWLVEDLERAFPVRFFRESRQVGAEPALEGVLTGLRKAFADHPKLPEVMADFEVAYRASLGAAGKQEVALNKLTKARAEWREIRDALLKEDRAASEDLVAWMERDIEERMAIARKRSGRGASSKASPTAKGAKPLQLVKATEAELAKRIEQTARTYEAFVTSMADANPEFFPAFAKLGAYLREDDPAWGRIAAKLAEHGPRTSAEDLSKAIHGIIGEALAMKNAWVVDRVVTASERATQLAAKLGGEWDAVITELPVLASTKSGGMGELYDASIWVVNRKTGEAAPVFVLQVKAGKVSEAADQIGRDFARELGDKVRLPAPTKGDPPSYDILNLRELLERERVKPGKGTLGDLSTQRVLVAPRPPSDASLRRALPRATAIEYVESVLSKQESLSCSHAIAKAWRRK